MLDQLGVPPLAQFLAPDHGEIRPDPQLLTPRGRPSSRQTWSTRPWYLSILRRQRSLRPGPPTPGRPVCWVRSSRSGPAYSTHAPSSAYRRTASPRVACAGRRPARLRPPCAFRRSTWPQTHSRSTPPSHSRPRSWTIRPCLSAAVASADSRSRSNNNSPFDPSL